MSVSLCGVFMVSQQCLVGPFQSYVPENEKNLLDAIFALFSSE